MLAHDRVSLLFLMGMSLLSCIPPSNPTLDCNQEGGISCGPLALCKPDAKGIYRCVSTSSVPTPDTDIEEDRGGDTGGDTELNHNDGGTNREVEQVPMPEPPPNSMLMSPQAGEMSDISSGEMALPQAGEMMPLDIEEAGEEMTNQAGEPMDEMVVTRPMGRGDTTALNCSISAHCPSARLSQLYFPPSPLDAINLGCDVIGHNRGAGVSSLLSIVINSDQTLDTANDLVTPDAMDNIRVLLLSEILHWEQGLTANESNGLRMTFYSGEPSFVLGYRISESSLTSNGDARVQFPATITDGLLETSLEGSNQFELPISDVYPFTLLIVRTALYGHLSLDNQGFSLNDAVLSGYLNRDGIETLVHQVQTTCIDPSVPFCMGLQHILSLPIDEAIAIIVSTLGGYDAHLNQRGEMEPCSFSPECDHISVCIGVGMESARISPI